LQQNATERGDEGRVERKQGSTVFLRQLGWQVLCFRQLQVRAECFCMAFLAICKKNKNEECFLTLYPRRGEVHIYTLKENWENAEAVGLSQAYVALPPGNFFAWHCHKHNLTTAAAATSVPARAVHELCVHVYAWTHVLMRPRAELTSFGQFRSTFEDLYQHRSVALSTAGTQRVASTVRCCCFIGGNDDQPLRLLAGLDNGFVSLWDQVSLFFCFFFGTCFAALGFFITKLNMLDDKRGDEGMKEVDCTYKIYI
jgi:hypothetical protein